MMNYDEYQFSREYLTSGERILWKGKPGKGNLLSSSDVFLIPFSIVWGVFAIFWEFQALSWGAPLFMVLFGVPFVLIGLYLIFGRFIHMAYIRKRSFYVITNEKIIRKCCNKIDMLNLTTTPPIKVKMHGDGYGTIFLEESTSFIKMRMSSFTPFDEGFVIKNIPNATQVMRLIVDTGKDV